MEDSFVYATVSGNIVTLKVAMGAGAPLNWWIRIVSKYDYGYGKGQGTGEYPWIVDVIKGNTATYTTTKTYKPGFYNAELNIMGIGPVDYSLFELSATEAGCISFNTTPARAKIIIDDQDTGQETPKLVCGLSNNLHTYRFVLPGFYDSGGALYIEPGQGPVVVNSQLNEIPKQGQGVGAGTILALGLLGVGVLAAIVYATSDTP